MNAKHTPGPWYETTTGNHQGLIISETDGANIAVAYDKRDASLIAAAPDLLKALNEILEQIECLGAIEYSKDLEPYKAEACWDYAVSRAHSVIARATGK